MSAACAITIIDNNDKHNTILFNQAIVIGSVTIGSAKCLITSRENSQITFLCVFTDTSRDGVKSPI